MAKSHHFLITLLLLSFLPGFAEQNNIRLKVQATYTSQIGIRELSGNNDGKSVEAYLKYCNL
jgi:hypothetical protein